MNSNQANYLLKCASFLVKQAGPMDWLQSAGKTVGDAMYSSTNKELAQPAPDPRMTSSQARMQSFGSGFTGQGNRSVTSTEQFNPDPTTRSGQIAGMQDQRNVQRAMRSRDSDVSSAAYARAQSNPRYKHLLENFDPATASYQNVVPNEPTDPDVRERQRAYWANKFELPNTGGFGY